MADVLIAFAAALELAGVVIAGLYAVTALVTFIIYRRRVR